jgi:RNA-binding protein YlmH
VLWIPKGEEVYVRSRLARLILSKVEITDVEETNMTASQAVYKLQLWLILSERRVDKGKPKGIRPSRQPFNALISSVDTQFKINQTPTV